MLCLGRVHCSPVYLFQQTCLFSGDMLWPNFTDKEFSIHGKTEPNRYFDSKTVISILFFEHI